MSKIATVMSIQLFLLATLLWSNAFANDGNHIYTRTGNDISAFKGAVLPEKVEPLVGKLVRPVEIPFRINCGAKVPYTERDTSITWKRDQLYVGGMFRDECDSLPSVSELYCTARSGSVIRYAIKVPETETEKRYTIIFHFIETQYEEAGKRLADIYVEGTIVKEAMDYYKEFGYMTPGTIIIDITMEKGDTALYILIKGKDDVVPEEAPTLNGIEVIESTVDSTTVSQPTGEIPDWPGSPGSSGSAGLNNNNSNNISPGPGSSLVGALLGPNQGSNSGQSVGNPSSSGSGTSPGTEGSNSNSNNNSSPGTSPVDSPSSTNGALNSGPSAEAPTSPGSGSGASSGIGGLNNNSNNNASPGTSPVDSPSGLNGALNSGSSSGTSTSPGSVSSGLIGALNSDPSAGTPTSPGTGSGALPGTEGSSSNNNNSSPGSSPVDSPSGLNGALNTGPTAGTPTSPGSGSSGLHGALNSGHSGATPTSPGTDSGAMPGTEGSTSNNNNSAPGSSPVNSPSGLNGALNSGPSAGAALPPGTGSSAGTGGSNINNNNASPGNSIGSSFPKVPTLSPIESSSSSPSPSSGSGGSNNNNISNGRPGLSPVASPSDLNGALNSGPSDGSPNSSGPVVTPGTEDSTSNNNIDSTGTSPVDSPSGLNEVPSPGLGQNTAVRTAEPIKGETDAPSTMVPSETRFVVNINSGYPGKDEFDNETGMTWLTDQYYVENGSLIAKTSNCEGMSMVYCSYRTGPEVLYNVPVPKSGSYVIMFYFIEPKFVGATKRVMNISLEDVVVYSDYDIFLETGALLKPIEVELFTNVTDGILNIKLKSTIDRGIVVSGIRIEEAMGRNNIRGPPPLPARINSGTIATDYTEPQTGVTWMKDAYMVRDGTTLKVDPCLNTTMDKIYCSYRLGYQINYNIPVEKEGTYIVTLYVMEPFFKAKKKRVMDVFLEDQKVLAGFDTVAVMGGKNKPGKVLVNNTVTDGMLNIKLQNLVLDQRCVLCGLKVEYVS